ncbi:methyltransferase CheR, SAM binding domain protein [Bacteriovorax sp. BSW11_IV]|uniref:CheR family methyltransferase n=1 Tax=Bacteriovorax sp. BSW11_IV TaxID=1353529 RepID=UPI00038A4A2A|nr:protein-glutamate O-methyltransferase CheR [Bacteriovorax sp. BSW11_IV]EQC49059.1 methyltransferase CheR, SAM binding domain protein [Bacteriovorax sp. BSW11_IV]
MISDDIYKFFADYIYKKSGMLYEKKDFYRLETRLKELVRIFEKNTVEEVYQMYQGTITPDMNAVLINISTNNETYFFRDVKPFKTLTKGIMPELLEKHKNGMINIWSAAASTGQEAYSILMSIHEAFGDEILRRSQCEATDISTDALSKAISGEYNGLDVQRGLPIKSLMTYFEQLDGDRWRIKHNIHTKVRFGEFNLLTDFYQNQLYHIVFCRNVLIYQDKENKNKILNNIYKSLRPGGYMLLGSGESLIGMKTEFEKVDMEGMTVYRRPAAS